MASHSSGFDFPAKLEAALGALRRLNGLLVDGSAASRIMVSVQAGGAGDEEVADAAIAMRRLAFLLTNLSPESDPGEPWLDMPGVHTTWERLAEGLGLLHQACARYQGLQSRPSPPLRQSRLLSRELDRVTRALDHLCDQIELHAAANRERNSRPH